MSKTILVVEDDARIAALICRYLDREKFLHHQVNSGTLAVSLFGQIKPDLVILDVMLPEMDGMTVCERIRSLSDVPIIIVSALGEDARRLEGFARGADDYLCKPFNPRELMARIHAVFRRYNRQTGPPNTIRFGGIEMDLEGRSVTVDGMRIELTQTEFNMLKLFLDNPARVLSRDALLNGSHGSFTESYARSVDFHIKNLRRKINTSEESRFIRAIYGVGYKLF